MEEWWKSRRPAQRLLLILITGRTLGGPHVFHLVCLLKPHPRNIHRLSTLHQLRQTRPSNRPVYPRQRKAPKRKTRTPHTPPYTTRRKNEHDDAVPFGRANQDYQKERWVLALPRPSVAKYSDLFVCVLSAGTRSVSTLTPSQLARKRANDREAQRAIRARTKEHIERLERELEDLKSRQNRDETVQNLIKRNKALERELMALRESLGIQGRPYPPTGMRHLGNMREPPLHVLTIPETGYDVDGLPTPASAVSSRASSFGQGSGDYGAAPGFGSSYLPTPEPCESWPTVVPVSSVSVPSVVSSPCSSTGHPDDYVPGYIPTSVPSSMMDGSGMQPQTISCLDGTAKVEYEDLENSKTSTGGETEIGFADWMSPSTDRGYCTANVPQSSSTSYLQQQSWSMYPTSAYYPQSPALQ